MAIIGTVIDAIRAAGMGYVKITIEPVLDHEKQQRISPSGEKMRIVMVRCKHGESKQMIKALADANMNLPIPYAVYSINVLEDVKDQWDQAFSLYNLEPHTLDDDQLNKAAGILGYFPAPYSTEIMDSLAHNFFEVEDEPLQCNMTFDEAVDAQERLESEMGIKTVVMVRCEGCYGVGAWSGDSAIHGEQDAECGCCNGRGVQYLPEAE